MILFRNLSFHTNHLFVLFCLASAPLKAQVSEIEKFDLVKEDSPVFIYERWVTFPGKVPAVKAREVKGEFLVSASMFEIFSILKDESKIKLWQTHVNDYKIYLQSDTLWLEYSYHDIPWPVSDQDHFLKYYLSEKIPGKELFISFESAIDSKLAPINEDVTRLELSGSWRLEQLSDTQVKVTYRILSMPGNIPRMFTDPVIRSNLMSTIKALTRLAEKN
jgi:hypothetical protein